MINDKDSLRDGLKLPPEARVAFVAWESQTEQMWRATLPTLLSHFDYLLVYPYPHGPRSAKHFRTFGGGNSEHIFMVDDWGMRFAADEVIMFRVIEDLLTDKPPVRIIDPANRWLSKELSQ